MAVDIGGFLIGFYVKVQKTTKAMGSNNIPMTVLKRRSPKTVMLLTELLIIDTTLHPSANIANYAGMNYS